MADYRYGNNVVAELSDAVAIGYDGSTADTTSMYHLVGQTGGQLWIRVYAHTAVTIGTGEYWYIEFQAYTADTAASADSPFSTANSGGINQATGTAEPEAHYYPLHCTSADGEASWAAGDLITEMAIPEKLCRLLSLDYVQLTNVTDKTDPGTDETIDVLVCVNPS